MKINEIERNINNTKHVAEKLLVENIGEATLWVLYHGFLNAIYSIREQLMKLDEEPCQEAIADWKKTNRRESMNNSLQEIRNLSTHQGIFLTAEYTDWEDDIVNDTEHPFKVRTVSITGKRLNRYRWRNSRKL